MRKIPTWMLHAAMYVVLCMCVWVWKAEPLLKKQADWPVLSIFLRVHITEILFMLASIFFIPYVVYRGLMGEFFRQSGAKATRRVVEVEKSLAFKEIKGGGKKKK